MSYVFLLHLLRQLLVAFEDNIVVSRMARELNLQAVSSLFAVQFSENRCIIFFYFLQQNLQTSFSWIADHSLNVAKSRRNLSKCESPEMVIRGVFRLFFFFLFLLFLVL